MTESQSLIRQSELPNRLVLDHKTAEDLGKVDEVWLDPYAHAIRGLTSQSGFWKKNTRAYTWECIKAIGKDSIMVDSGETDTTLEKPETVKSVIGHELWTGSGSKVGHIVDCLIAPETGKVVHYLFRSDGWSGLMEGVYALRPSAISSIGSKRLIAEDEAVRQSEKYAEGLDEKLHAAQDFLKRDVEKTKEEWDVAQQKGRAIATQVKETTQAVTEQLKDKFVQAESSEEVSGSSDNSSEANTANGAETR